MRDKFVDVSRVPQTEAARLVLTALALSTALAHAERRAAVDCVHSELLVIPPALDNQSAAGHLRYALRLAGPTTSTLLDSRPLELRAQGSMASATETTPNSSRHATQPLNSRSHSVRTAATASLDDAVPPARPVFLDQPLFMNALAGPSRAPPVLGNKSVNGAATSVPMQTTRIDGRQFGTAASDFNKASTNTRKRTLAETTTTTTTTARENGHSPDESAARQVKRLRAAAAAGVPVPGEGGGAEVDAVAAATAAAIARRKQRKAERGAGIEKLQQDTQQWRQKYRKAFPSFTFYFDAIDEATQSTLGSAVRKLGAVRRCRSSPSRSLGS